VLERQRVVDDLDVTAGLGVLLVAAAARGDQQRQRSRGGGAARRLQLII
jgi:hypothetical protein